MYSPIQEIYLNVHCVQGTGLGAVEMKKAQFCSSGAYELVELFNVPYNKWARSDF